LQREALGRDAVGRVKSGSEGEFSGLIREAAEERGLPVVDAKSTEELGVGGEAPPALGHEGCAQAVGRLRGEAEEDLVEQVVVFQRMRPCRRRRGGPAAAAGAAAAGHCGPRSWALYWVGEPGVRRSWDWRVGSESVRLGFLFLFRM
jgi:hypothetical protein